MIHFSLAGIVQDARDVADQFLDEAIAGTIEHVSSDTSCRIENAARDLMKAITLAREEALNQEAA